MPTLLLKNADVLVTMDGTRREIPGGGLFARDGIIEAVGTDLPETADVIVDAKGCVVTPGLVNTHHHLYQKHCLWKQLSWIQISSYVGMIRFTKQFVPANYGIKSSMRHMPVLNQVSFSGTP